MQRIIFTKDYAGYKEGEVFEFYNNEAHGFVDKGVAKIYKYSTTAFEEAPKDKMMRATGKRKYKTKKI